MSITRCETQARIDIAGHAERDVLDKLSSRAVDAQVEKGDTSEAPPISPLTQSAIVVPASERQGLLSSLEIIPQINNAQNYTRRTKWCLTLIAAIAALPAPMGTAIILRACIALIRSGRLRAYRFGSCAWSY